MPYSQARSVAPGSAGANAAEILGATPLKETTMKPRRTRFPQSFALALTVLLAVAGCSDLPTKPPIVIESEPGATATGEAPAEILGLDLLGGADATTTKTATIGLLGGVVSVGNFTVVIPAGALTRTATVTVSQPDLQRPVVNLSISPASANRFLLPVLLVADAKRMDRSLLSVACIAYYNPETAQWEPVAGSAISLLNLTVTAPLWHFSTYRVQSGGKAGW
jgi:hypothetical protein